MRVDPELLAKRKKWLSEPPRLRKDDKNAGLIGHEVYLNSAFGFSFGIQKVSGYLLEERAEDSPARRF